MSKFKPSIYKQNIFEIQYKKLKKEGITCLIFDLDNTLGLIEEKSCPEKVKALLEGLKKDFRIVICSNNTASRIIPYMKELGIGGVAWSLKPLTRGLKRIQKKYHLQKEQMCMIGDQMVTDVLAGNRFGIKTILVEPLGEKDLKITSFNRMLENYIVKKYQKKGLFERGKYYE